MSSQIIRTIIAIPIVVIAWYAPAELFGLAGVVWFFIGLAKFIYGKDEY